MISRECFTKSWLDKVKSTYPIVDPTIIEKSIYALELLSLLKLEGIDFIFKGGTALLLLLSEPKRLSIDVDVSLNILKENLEEKLNSIIKKGTFNNWIEDPRKESKIPKKHYKIFFDSKINPNIKSYILLDVLFQEDPYPKLTEKIIQTDFVILESEISVKLPTINSLLGDKLTALAPNTTGIPFGIGKEMQINKQLFDIGELFEFADDVNEIKKSFERFIKIQSDYKNKNFSYQDVIKDLYEICFLICQINVKGSVKSEVSDLFISGIKAMRSHLMRGTYNLENAKIYSSRTAFLVSFFGKNKDFEQLKKFNISKITNLKLSGSLMILERLRNILPESYYYWQIIQKELE
ncbi:Hypothetical protein IALB_1235 [Ignavibacterium album JCM 16511]|uniref:Nucleotidyl transferase AbiEii/AbiGii toxin family protein n=1 Tax=Ignavibacterium album (strain DSM 19864 / JCM 16511 / NBRC 101810 / Mat9-16) TaxID=945713 RepID=I0AIY9_IGNAJ|nr:nucleotidyl transferase AbiEii/AbiGii toxin family protein [Ignavibacterium album]AFH48946.1 Hypothetical protein IALB_1235 [Ignavibacterium album JCM 16511]